MMDAYVFPVSSEQRRMWFLELLNPGSLAYHIPLALRLRGALDAAALEASLRTIVQRHEVLRTGFATEQGAPVQVIATDAPLALERIELTGATPAEREDALWTGLAAQAGTAFDLTRAPLIRTVLFALGPEDHVLFVNVHHIVCDGWSLGVLGRELTVLYPAFRHGNAAPLPALPLQYADFAEWQSQWLQSGTLAPQEEYWRRRLAGSTAALVLPFDRPRPAVPSHRGGVVRRALPAERLEAIRALARHEDATLFMVLLAAFAAWLHRHSAQEDLCIGTPVANRLRPELEPLIGLFVNTIVLRTTVTRAMTFRELVRTVRAEALDAFAHQELPFDHMVELLHPQRDQSRSPLFQAMFVLQNAPVGRVLLPGLEVESLPVANGTAKFDVTLTVEEGGTGPAGIALEYNADLFDHATAERLLERYSILVEGIVAAPGARLGDLPLLAPGDSAKLPEIAPAPGAVVAARPQPADGAGATPGTPNESVLAEIWRAVLGGQRVRPDDSFFDLGGDSILALQVVAKARERGLKLTARQIFQHQVLREQAAAAGGDVPGGAPPGPVHPTDDGREPLTPIQAWFFEQRLPNPHHWNQSLMLAVAPDVGRAQFAAAWAAVTAAHDTLQLRFRPGPGATWTQTRDPAAAPVPLEEIGGPPSPAVLARLQEGLNIERGPVARAAWFDAGAGEPARVALVLHHLVIDGVSWRILIDDLRSALAAIQAGREPKVAPPAATYSQWSHALATEAARVEVVAEGRDWVAAGGDPTAELPRDHPASGEHNLAGSVAAVTLEFSAAETAALLRDAPEALRARPAELLLAALGSALAAATGLPVVRVLMEGHGREELATALDVTRTLGWFTSLFPLALAAPDAPDAKAWLRVVKQRLRTVERAGLGYGLNRYLAPDAAVRAALAAQPAPEISFNYLGQIGAGDDAAQVRAIYASAGVEHDPRGRRPHVLDVVAVVADDRLRVDWQFSGALHRRETIAGWAARFAATLRELLVRGGESAPPVLVPADFPLANLNQAAVDRLLTPLGTAVEDVYPLSPLQEGMLFHAVNAPHEAVYFEQLTGRLRGVLDPAAFARAWQRLLRRHSGLRAGFHWENLPAPLQVVWREVTCPCEVRDWRALDPAEHEREVERFLEADRRRGFDLARPPLLRVALLQLGEREWQWVWSHHHLLLDGWSIAVVLGEFLVGYEAEAGGPAPQLAPARPYRDYLGWLARQDRAAGERFWREQLRGVEEAMPWRLAGADDAAHGATGHADEDLRLAPELERAMQALAQSGGLTLNTVLQGAWALLLQRLSGGRDVVFGVTVAGRPPELAGVETRVGLFINTLPVRVACDPAQPVLAWLRGLQATQAAMREFEYCRLVDIQGWSEVPRGQPLFDTLMVFENYPVDEQLRRPRAGLEFGPVRFIEHANYPVTFVGLPRGGLTLRISHDRTQVSSGQARTLLAAVRCILEAMTQAPAAHLGDIAPGPAAERDRLVSGANGPAREWGAFQPAQALFEEWADATPAAPALAQGAAQLSYAELEARANRLAAHLRRAGAGPEKRVGVCLPRSPGFIVALLAILKSGAGYVPLDPAYPRARLATMIEDAGMALIVSDTTVQRALPATTVPVVQLDAAAAAIAQESAERRAVPLRPEHAAYVIFTSGSTGRPKGVVVPHAGAKNLVRSQGAEFDVTPASRIYQFASPSFDASIAEIFMAFGAGACLVLPPADESRAADVLQVLREERISHVTLPPSLLAALPVEALPELHTLIVAGEAGAPEVFAKWGQGRRIFNAYGPTECTVCATMEDCSAAPAVIALGRAIANSTLHVLDSAGQPVPPGVVGEIYLGGIGVARGYLGRPDLTAEAFVPDPFGGRPGARLYRTGDRGARLDDGRVRYLGRCDQQVKVRGLRLELGEIETTLRTHPAVRDAVVLAPEETPGQRRLVAGVLAGAPLAGAELREFLSARLPAAAVPAGFIIVERWPLSPNGKIDRRALLALATKPAPAPAGAAGAPRTEVERKLAEIWGRALGRDSVAPADNYFELGGDSILSLQIVSLARQAGYELSPRDLFEQQTLERVAAVMRQLAAVIGEAPEPPGAEIPLLPIQRWFFERELPAPHHWNQSLVLATSEPLAAEALAAAWRDVAGQHDALRLRFERTAEGWKQFYGAPGTPPELTIEPGADFAARAAELQASLNLSAGPLFRAAWFARMDGAGGRLLLVAHHLIIDGVSWRILLEDLMTAYAARRAAGVAQLPLRTAAYRRWAERLQEHARSAALRAEAEVWRRQWSRTVPSLPLDFPATPEANQVRHQESHAVELTAETTQVLLQESAGALRARLPEVLLAALAQALREWTGNAACRIDLEGHGRETIDENLSLARTVGWCTSQYPLQVELPMTDDPAAVLKSVKEQMRAVPGHGLGYGVLRFLGEPELRAEFAALPGPDLGFNYLGQTDPAAATLGPFHLAAEEAGPAQAPEQPRAHVLEIDCRVEGRRLRAGWRFSRRLHRRETIARIAEAWRRRLEALAAQARAPGVDTLAPSDFRQVSLTANELEALLGDLASGKEDRP